LDPRDGKGRIVIEWTPAFGPAAVFAGIAAFFSIGTAIFIAIKGLGYREADSKALAKRFDELESELNGLLKSRADYRETDRKEREAFQVSVNAGLDMSRASLSDFQRTAAERFATKGELVALEDRTNKGMDRIVDRLEQISGRLETIGDAIIKTLADHRNRV
jgi:hypothetical protein